MLAANDIFGIINLIFFMKIVERRENTSRLLDRVLEGESNLLPINKDS